MSGPGDWDTYLDPGEHILWTGQPPQGFRMERGDIFVVPFSLVWGGVAVPAGGAMMLDGIMEPDISSVVMIPFGGLFFFMGLHLLIGRFLVDRWIRRNTRYAITNRRAYIATRTLRRRSLESMAITATTPVGLSLGRRASITIGVENQAASNPGILARFDSDAGKFVFEGLEDGEQVYQLIRRIQRGDA